ncbi:MGMT family protein [Shewanella sp. SR44-3]|uniref:MGMT family protein n=1 Tax=unclassified Shewanella TaxID=196818 RepID=UPI0015F7B668|nr:methylated-DNA--[protein]-cysteine S-methyltransferase [Shewanella sp. SR44-3]MBB1270435.1 methylated-DNA--[protein]-cysteine S-methyltransferase [Shewanella sp. SR44-3]
MTHPFYQPQGSQSQKLTPKERIWFVVALIPEGKVISYGKIADLAGLPGRARYVSRALKEAPEHLILPWHRVINSQGKISFDKYSQMFQHQMQCLRTEGVPVNSGKIALSEFEWRPEMATLVMSLPF